MRLLNLIALVTLLYLQSVFGEHSSLETRILQKDPPRFLVALRPSEDLDALQQTEPSSLFLDLFPQLDEQHRFQFLGIQKARKHHHSAHLLKLSPTVGLDFDLDLAHAHENSPLTRSDGSFFFTLGSLAGPLVTHGPPELVDQVGAFYEDELRVHLQLGCTGRVARLRGLEAAVGHPFGREGLRVPLETELLQLSGVTPGSYPNFFRLKMISSSTAYCGMFQIFNFTLVNHSYFVGLVLDHRAGLHRLHEAWVQARYGPRPLDVIVHLIFVRASDSQVLPALEVTPESYEVYPVQAQTRHRLLDRPPLHVHRSLRLVHLYVHDLYFNPSLQARRSSR